MQEVLRHYQDRLVDSQTEAGQLRVTVAELVRALKLYAKLDNDHRAGCEISYSDWAECFQAASAAIEHAKETNPPTL